jgi:putative SOS response-associated peptidase YedK
MLEVSALALFPADKRMKPGEYGHVIAAHGDGSTSLEELHWGLRPRDGGRPWGLIRSEGKSFDGLRCIVPVDDFSINGHHPNPGKWQVVPTRPNAAFAGIWRRPYPDWPASYALLTVEAGPDLAPYEPRQNIVLWEEDWRDWLHHLRPAEEILRAPPMGSLVVERRLGRSRAQREAPEPQKREPSLFGS